MIQNVLKGLALMAGLLISLPSFGQYSYKDLDEFKQYRQALEIYNKNAFAQVIPMIDEFLATNKKVYESEFQNIRIHAELLKAQSALYSDQPDGEELLVDFIEKYKPDPQANEALFNLADYYFRSRKYDQAIQYYSMIASGTLDVEQYSETAFKLGYSYFVKKDFEKAQAEFHKAKNVQSEYYYDLNYYYGVCAYFQEDFQEAISAWKVAENDKSYGRLIPYYLTQIYFANGQYQELISYALPYSQERGVRNQKEINQLIGQSYFELGDYEKAQPYLEEYEANSGSMRAEDFYQLAYVQYKNGDYEKAIPNFKELSNEENSLGQTAMYYLAESYMQVGNKGSARNAFYNVVQYKDNMPLRENSLLNYGKLSAELGYDVDAINAFSKFLPTSQFYNEAQELMAEVLINTKNFKKSIEIMERLDELSPSLKEAYQKITLNQASLDIKNNDLSAALGNLEKSLKYTPSTALQAKSFFWKGEILSRQEKYAQSEGEINKYLAIAKAANAQAGKIDFEVSESYAHYIQGYNHVKTNDCDQAIRSFESSISLSKAGSQNVSNDQSKLSDRIMGDAYIRIGDCYFKLRDYNKASQRYLEAANRKVSGYDYALYQNAQIQGLLNQPNRKMQSLDRLISEQPSSSYADAALFEKANTFIELNEMQQAIIPLRQLVSKYKGRSNLINKAYFKLGLIEYNLGNSDQALGYYKEILNNNPTSEESRNALAAIEEIYVIDQGNTDAYFDVLETVPGMKVGQKQKDSLQYSVANSFYENGQYEKAALAYGEYLNRYPKGLYVLDALFNRGESNVLLKKFGEALNDYEKVIAKGNSSYYRDAVKKAAIIAYNDQKNFEKALKYYAMYEELATGNDEKFTAQVNALNSAFEIGNQEAILQFANKVKDNPLANSDQKSLAYFTIGKAAIEAGQPMEGLQNFGFVIQNSDNEQTAESRYLIAKILYDQENYEQAAVKSKEAYTENGAYPYWVAKSLLLNSKILIKQDDLFNARAAVEAVKENFSSDPGIISEADAILQQITQLEKQNSRIDESSNSGELQLDYENN
ncbi:tetratricopeptide repeat protein [Membranihabitans maritimus]|uniref:tetratricopeptide repeat protein n=1 Tax=Membranihabitans maritimus TaxID=2904244 RepID=UPI001F2506C4|nr:tetratricopeptide repeat protein [Membranihabitans maritimus]